ncbi:hypothetical protein C1646_769542 [Rhizophagus diaphanus]|nr:hypothetical protein C1646_769542 [Rhizophagus diaphanus] [Rhizophagus sp. MUCL 43196]
MEQYGVMKNDIKRYEVIKNDMERYGVIKNDLERYEVMENNIEQYGVMKNDIEQYGMIKNNMEQYGVMKNDIERYEQYGVMKNDMEQYGVMKNDMKRYEVIENDMKRYEVMENDMEQYGVNNIIALNQNNGTRSGMLRVKRWQSRNHLETLERIPYAPALPRICVANITPEDLAKSGGYAFTLLGSKIYLVQFLAIYHQSSNYHSYVDDNVTCIDSLSYIFKIAKHVKKIWDLL